MRIGTSVLFTDGYCYQSYGWNKFRPLGKLQNIIDSLEEYQCDEIAIIRPVRKNDSLKLFKKDIDTIKNLKSMTPLSFGGGLRSKEHLDMLHDLPIERLIFSSSFIQKDYKTIEYAVKTYGRQAIQCLLPFIHINDTLKIFTSSQNSYTSYENIDLNAITELANEIILMDTTNEGINDMFNKEILNNFNIDYKKLIFSGGIGNLIIKYAKKQNIASVLIENKTLHKEYSIKGYRHA